jgi:hypothetical protein
MAGTIIKPRPAHRPPDTPVRKAIKAAITQVRMNELEAEGWSRDAAVDKIVEESKAPGRNQVSRRTVFTRLVCPHGPLRSGHIKRRS